MPEVRVAVEDSADKLHLDAAVTREFTEAHPALIELTIGNATGDPLGVATPPPRMTGAHSQHEVNLRATPTDLADPVEFEECWKAPGSTLGAVSVTNLDPGATLAHEYVLTMDHDADYCLPDGFYQFELSVKVGDTDFKPPMTEDTDSVDFDWAVCLSRSTE